MKKRLYHYQKQYNEFADEYLKAQNAFYKNHENTSRQSLYREINFSIANKKLLDIGCGFGKDLAYFEKEGAEVYGIDLSERMIELAKTQNPTLQNLSIQDFNNTNFENNFFDIIISRYALHYSEDLETTFKEIHRILKPKGLLIFLVAHPLLGFVAKKEKIYNKMEIVEIPIYNNTFVVKEPTHTFSDYLNKFVLENFEFLSFYENSDLENASREADFKEVVPDFFILKLRKK